MNDKTNPLSTVAVDPLVSCECHQCIKDFDLRGGDGDDFFSMLPLSATKYILCPDCGNKRCPKASNDRLACTDSNVPGQPGSVYS